MKNIFKLGFVVLFATALGSCEEDRVVLNTDQEYFQFQSSRSDLAASNEMVVRDTIYVGATNISNEDRVIPLNIDATSTATADQYVIQGGPQVVIPAGEYVGTVVVEAVYDALPETGAVTLIFTIDETQYTILNEQSFHIVSLFRFCPSDLAGNYSVTTTYGFHDFLADYPSNTMDVEITAVENQPNVYKVKDFSGGLYSVGPYATAYGTGAPTAAGSIDLIFSAVCGSIVWSGQADPWGDIVRTGGAVNSYDEATGIITISWTALGYGENGVSVYTPID